VKRSFLALSGIAATIGAVMLVTYQNLRINLSESMPTGLYWVSDTEKPVRGDFVTICLPGEAGRMAFERGYIGHGKCPDDHAPLLKPVVAVEGDFVTVEPDGVKVNGQLLANSAPFRSDTEGRPMSVVQYGRYGVEPGTIWVIAGHDSRSYDSRYFGAVPLAAITGTARALLVQ
jgi:conjugative transfer signal peptidase TraF